ncbi:MAG: hypothetical protein JNM66_21250, partial [Bryobacterales bacterium]|nr:hypothetical protein [Bryobacterales bacterium]
RQYNPGYGRFVTPDENLADQDVGDPLSWNLYAYARNNPLRYSDPTGRTCQKMSNGTVYDDLDGKGCAAVDEADKNKKPDVSVGVGWDAARLIMLAGVGESLTSPQTWGSITRGAMENAYPLTSTIVECAASRIGGNCNSDSEILYAAAAKPKLAQAAARIARLWTITRPAATKVVGGRTYLKDAKTKTWWSRDAAGHGGSAWKVYEERGGKLEWIADADAHGNFISGKHKSPFGTLLK